MAVNNKEAILLSIEAKSGTGDALYVQPDQLNRCLMISTCSVTQEKTCNIGL